MKYIDLFSGAGGMSLGIKKAGGKLLYSNEMDSYAAQTQKHNLRLLDEDENKVIVGSIEDLHKEVIGKKVKMEYQSKVIHSHKSMVDSYNNNTTLTEADINLVKNIKEVDLLVGGPPCQGFSNVGRGKKKNVDESKEFVDDPRNQLFKYFLDFVEYQNPKIVLIENVKGIKSAKGYLNLICKSLQSTGNNYTVEYYLQNSFYFGVPQKRERIFVVGIRKDIKDAENFKFYLRTILSGFDKKRYVLKDAISDLPTIKSNPKSNNVKIENEIPIGDKKSWGEDESTKNYSDLIKKKLPYVELINRYQNKIIIPEKLYNHKCRFNNKLDLEVYKLMIAGKYLNSKDNFEAIQIIPYGTKEVNGKMEYKSSFLDKYFKLHPEKPSKTITAHLLRDNNGFIHYGKIPRGISVREAARIQSFPDWYKFTGPFTNQFKQIGNAVPPLVAEAFGKIFVSFLNEGFDVVVDLNN